MTGKGTADHIMPPGDGFCLFLQMSWYCNSVPVVSWTITDVTQGEKHQTETKTNEKPKQKDNKTEKVVLKKKISKKSQKPPFKKKKLTKENFF